MLYSKLIFTVDCYEPKDGKKDERMCFTEAESIILVLGNYNII